MTCRIRSRVTVAGKVLGQIGEEFKKKNQVVSYVFITYFEVPTILLLPNILILNKYQKTADNRHE